MKYHLLLALPLLFTLISHAAPISIYGPKKFSAGLQTKEYQVSIPGPGANKDGVITITNGDGQDFLPLVCNGTFVQKILCGVENLRKALLTAIQRPSTLEIYWNNQLLATKSNLPQIKGKLQIPIKVQTQNTLRVRLQGLPTAYLNIEIKSESATVNQLPIARINANPTTGIAPEVISLSGLSSSDPDSDPLTNYSWDFGDGSFATGALVTHSYLTAGTFLVRLTVSDSKGGVGTSTQTISISANQLPIANFVSTSNTGIGILKVHFDATSSSDLDGQIISYQYDFGDGNSAGTAVADHIYAQPGTYQVTMTVQDNKNGVSSKTLSLTVQDAVAPSVTIQSPISGSVIAQNQINIAGISNEKLLQAVATKSDGASINLSISSDGLRFSGDLVETRMGSQTISISAKDLAGNTTLTTLQVYMNAVGGWAYSECSTQDQGL